MNYPIGQFSIDVANYPKPPIYSNNLITLIVLITRSAKPFSQLPETASSSVFILNLNDSHINCYFWTYSITLFLNDLEQPIYFADFFYLFKKFE